MRIGGQDIALWNTVNLQLWSKPNQLEALFLQSILCYLMSRFLRHEPCGECGSSDAKGIYDDGHTYCWSCQARTSAKTTSAEQVASILLPTSQENKFDLPLDISKNIPNEPYQWLKGYGVTNDEIEIANIGWSEGRQMLIFPFYGEFESLLCWQGRYFPTRTPKVFTSGYPDRHALIYNFDGLSGVPVVCVVEDCISALKVSRLVDSSPLFGANLSTHKALSLSRLYSKLIIWLDSDKYATAVKLSNQFKVLFDDVKVIYTEKDPKEYSTNEIKEYLSVQ
jgi:hypothetical protein